MLIAIVPALMVLLGLLLWALCSNPKAAEAGKWIFIAGVFALAFTLASKTVHVG